MILHILISRLLALSLWCFSRIFYRFEVSWVKTPPANVWKNIRVFAFLNHTSLLEPLFLGAFPPSFLWDAASRTRVPGADKTMNRPIVGRFYKFFSPQTISISRKRDESWDLFLEGITPEVMVALAPEGRMMRANGLDSEGKPMSVRGGIADILQKIGHGKMMLGYSGGLHHVNIPGQKKVKLFKKLQICFEIVEIAEYLQNFNTEEKGACRLQIARDLETRLAKYKPHPSA
ncbi:hypothetical protein COW36_17400 [bacterium (Candidatus Blackallbacteria) CG17_big_fil_post_rev_8_21_14_2_50_48_46]|uniref:Phospholipid/glycerol acyltransferase domain-containing protein n=1 Tax=bacterium (Candidatus Blackallbacteria) CG17_big_fil_post_rev_8_21_14_2_50_48_46 TaxID=2014261 RepID=A0A2M7G0F1_9BACT|nr:MAG: hypothetical protein COW64_01330 [bacterium (Candidatus Blackallbacteria) CG18_big_fil_WC_8_21_14_2_50_49_26]PIW15198.1 MAG: hypothetical protein COW36_17400 [bacterium (Candidatus Blackallbacteria) CG17_big_fil_post_rev_8_21_14_2_50_48_46]PIW44785.1 MAG: hypothetical protein COW20_22735 [bacterium (Candidatus Blackallbacteria) CG13_big_fil_rev_8_21_14_2_50_49_14]